MTTATRVRAACVALVVSLLTTGCVPGFTTGGGITTEPAGPVSTDVSDLENVTLREVDFFAEGSEDAWWTEVVAAFERKHPNIDIQRTTQSFDDVMKTLNLKLSGNDPPDIAPANNGWQSLGTLVQGGLVLNLDNYAKAYGWEERLPPTVRRQHAFSTDGTRMGTGSLFGVPTNRSTVIGVYYNRAKLEELGLEVPTTLAEFEAACAAAKRAGETPIELGTLEQWQATALLFSIQNALGDQDRIADFTYSQGEVALADTGMTPAAATLQRWATSGWFTEDFSGVSADDAAASFAQGSGVFHFDYSGAVPFEEDRRADYGFFVLGSPDGNPVATGAAASNFSISSKTEHPDAAAAFLDFISSPEVAELAVKHGQLPLVSSKELTVDDPLFAEELGAQRRLEAADAYVPYFDWSTPTFLDALAAQTQELLAGNVRPEDLVEVGQRNYDEFQAKRAS